MKRFTLIFLLLCSFSAFAQEEMSNLTPSPNAKWTAYTKGGNLYVQNKASMEVIPLTDDGSDLVLNGYASWVYYEEIFGRSSKYKAFWWSPDSKKIAFYRFDNTQVPMFPIYSPKGQDGSLNLTRYPKAGEKNPDVKIGVIDLSVAPKKGKYKIVWADFDAAEDQYFGTPFWSDDSKALYVQREPRIQNTLDLYRVDAATGSKSAIYHETYKTWLDWIDDMLFSSDGLYMVRSFETGWEQIYFLGYDGSLKRLTDGPNWRMSLKKRDSKTGDIYFTAQRDSRVRSALYKLASDGSITALTDTLYNVDMVEIGPDGKIKATLSNSTTPKFTMGKKPKKADDSLALPRIISIKADDGQDMYASIVYPKSFDASKKYPVHFEIYGGPNTPSVTDRWRNVDQWWSENEIIHMVIDVRASGHTGRAGTDLDYLDVCKTPVQDAVTWAKWMASQSYVDAAHMGIEGFSFGGSMTAMLLFNHSDLFRCGIAGGGVYDWKLYDTHYTERFMSTPALNSKGYRDASPINYVSNYPGDGTVMLKLTHGTADDNVHFQNTLQLVEELQNAGKQFELMIYPDGMHGYRGKQAEHSKASDRIFWLKYLKNQ